MWQFIKAKVNFFLGGFVAGIYPAIYILFNNPNIYLSFVLRCIGAIVIAFLSGIVTVFAHDVYKHYVKNKFFKHANKEKDNQDNESKVA